MDATRNAVEEKEMELTVEPCFGPDGDWTPEGREWLEVTE